jgi:hypothetical protein
MFRSIVSLATLIVLAVIQFQIDGQTRRPPARPAQPPANAQSLVVKSAKNEKLTAAFHTGQLPEPSRKPRGKPDEVAASLAKTIAAGDDQSTPALLTAILTAGFVIRDSDGGVTQTVQPGQGLIFDAWEIAAGKDVQRAQDRRALLPLRRVQSDSRTQASSAREDHHQWYSQTVLE